MKPLAASLALLLAACSAPSEPVAVSGEPVTERRGGADDREASDTESLPVLPHLPDPTTTTSPPTLPPPTVAAATTTPPTTGDVVPATAAPAVRAGGCGGWDSLVASLWPAEQVATSCRIMLCESNGNPSALNPSGASGLYQIMPLWADDFARVTGQPYYDGRFDATANATFARWLWGQSGWQPWVCQ